MTVNTYSHNEAINVTTSAATHFKKQLEKSANKAIRVSLKESGCTGYKYVIDEVQAAEEGDLTIELDNGVSVYLNPSNLAALQGTVIDYQQQGLNYNLVLNNPNVKDACGCGESFSF